MEKYIKNLIGNSKETDNVIIKPLNKLKTKDIPINKDSYIMRR